MGAFYTVANLPVDDTEKFCAWCLSEFSWKDDQTPLTARFSGQDLECIGETIMMAPVAGFYTNPLLGKKQVRLACKEKEDLQRALFILEKALEKYNSVKQIRYGTN